MTYKPRHREVLHRGSIMKLLFRHPHTKLVLACSVFVLSLIYDFRFVFMGLVPMLALIHLISKTFKTWITCLLLISPYLALLLMITSITASPNGTLWVNFGVFQISNEIVLLVLNQSKSVVALVFLVMSLISFTPRKDWLAAYPCPSLGFTIVFILITISTTLTYAKQQAKAVAVAQQLRGVDIQGSILTRIKSIWPIIMPLSFFSIMMNQQHNLTYYTRGFDINRSRNPVFAFERSRMNSSIEWMIMMMTFTLVIIEVLV